MTDEELDQLLTGAGARWRDANASVATVDFESLEADVVPLQYEDAAPAPIRRRRLWPWFIAAVAAAALALGITLAVRPSNDSHSNVATGAAAPYGTWRATDGTVLSIEAQGGGADLQATFGCGAVQGAVTVTQQDSGTGGTIVLPYPGMTVTNSCPLPSGEPLASIAVPGVFSKGTTQWQTDGGKLALTRSGDSLIFTRSGSAPAEPALLGTSWTLSNFTDASGATSSDVGSASLTISRSGAYTGNDGCNGVSGTAEITGPPTNSSGDATGTVSFLPDAHAQLACSSAGVFDSVMQGEGAAQWQIYGSGKLAITRTGVGTLVFVSVAGASTSPSSHEVSGGDVLKGTSWVLQSWCDGSSCNTASWASGVTAPRLELTDQGRFLFTDGCHQKSGTIDIQDRTLSLIASDAITQNLCGTESVLQVLVTDGTELSWTLSSDMQLTIRNGSNSLIYTQQESPAPTGQLHGTNWVLDSYCSKNACSALSRATGTGPDLAFEDSTFTGQIPCGTQFQGTYTLDSPLITLAHVTFLFPLVSTDGRSVSGSASVCGTDVYAPIYAVLAASKVTWSAQGNSLQLSVGDSTLKYVPYTPLAASTSP